METSSAASPAKEDRSEWGLNEWRDLLENSAADHPDHQKAFDEALKLSDDLEELEWLYDKIDSESSLLPAVMAKLDACEVDLDDCVSTYSNRSDLDAFSNALLARMIALAKSSSDWISIWSATSDSHDDDLETVKKALEKVEWTKEQWEELRDDDTEEGDISLFAYTKLLGFYATAVEIVKFYFDYVENYDTDSDVKAKIFEKLFSVATRQEVQLISAVTSDDDLCEAADEFLKA